MTNPLPTPNQDEDKLSRLIDKFFIIRAGTPDDNLEQLKLRNESGSPEVELKAALRTLLVSERIDELKAALEFVRLTNMDLLDDSMTDYLDRRIHQLQTKNKEKE